MILPSDILMVKNNRIKQTLTRASVRKTLVFYRLTYSISISTYKLGIHTIGYLSSCISRFSHQLLCNVNAQT